MFTSIAVRCQPITPSYNVGNEGTDAKRIVVMDVSDGTISRPLNPFRAIGKFFESHPAWSPDGTQIAYQRQKAGKYHQIDLVIAPIDWGPHVVVDTVGPIGETRFFPSLYDWQTKPTS